MSLLPPEVTLLCAKFNSSTFSIFSCSSATRRLAIAGCPFPKTGTHCSGSLSTLCGSSPSRLVDHRTSLRPEDQIYQQIYQIFYFYYTHTPHIGRQLSRRCYFVPKGVCFINVEKSRKSII